MCVREAGAIPSCRTAATADAALIAPASRTPRIRKISGADILLIVF